MNAPARLAAPGFLQHLLLLWGLRLRIGTNRGSRPSRVAAALAFAASSAPAPALAVSTYQLFVWSPVAGSAVWPRFILGLLCFVTTCVWCAWPVLAAGVDDHSELSRYAAFPISPFRLMLASTLAGVLEPRSLVFYGPLVGATVATVRASGPGVWLGAALLFLTYVLMNAALARVGLHVVLNVLRQKRSAELIGGFFVVVLIAASFIPPIDTSWLLGAGGGLGKLSEAVLADAARALSRVPPGWLARGVWQLQLGDGGLALGSAIDLATLTVLALGVAYGLLLQFHRQSGSEVPASKQRRTSNPFARTNGRLLTLATREAIDLWNNPRARLLAAVPFLLAILLKLVSGRDLFVYALGQAADAWLMAAFSLYGAVVLGSTFAQNAFAYDGHGFAAFLGAPLRLADVLKAKNLVHGGAAAMLGLWVCCFYLAYFRRGSVIELVLALEAVLGVVPVLLAAGNFLSLVFPVRFHASLQRRDKLPFAASMLGVGAASLGASPFAALLRDLGRRPPSASTLGTAALLVVLAWGVYLALLPWALRMLERRREQVLSAVTRD